MLGRFPNHVAFLGLISAMTSASPDAVAQGYAFSQRGIVAQTVAFTDITVHYGRPVARGRTPFADSGLVPYGNIWHHGADSATRISFSRDVLVEGRPLKADEYSLWLIPRGGAPWTLIVSSAAERTAHMETMAIYFPVVLRDDAVMRIHWGEWALPIRIKATFRPPDGE